MLPSQITDAKAFEGAEIKLPPSNYTRKSSYQKNNQQIRLKFLFIIRKHITDGK